MKVGLPEIVEAVQVTGLLVPFVVKVSAPPTIGITNQLVDELAAILHPPVTRGVGSPRIPSVAAVSCLCRRC